ncbi:hypothetical protein EST38_g11418 [Candolleomyces aberdarensis]|uniref:HAT C-terminal dimerisation domain-containing protein n=1 Tax=Candolleomyces aberdarensis TaxID=2316362 RepID=A0A4Q2D786_9AGAR|nr:hypothetical protein EST38_g11418 [Candolleomyces aberdarensis]
MLDDFEMRLNLWHARKNVRDWDAESSHIRCLAHNINLATQAVLGTYSKTPHYDPGSTAPLEPNVDVTHEELMRDVVGIVQCIAVKARSSAKRNALLKELQAKDGVKIPLTLLVDMKVRWSSTYLMLERAYELHKFADQAQQAFSSETEPSLYNGLPALERLHKAWTSRSKKDKYKQYRPALEAGLVKIKDYYDKTSYSHAYTMAMILDPDSKTNYFQKHWGNKLELEIRDNAEKIFEARWKELNEAAEKATITPSALKSRLHDNDSSDEEATPLSGPSTGPSSQPWLKEFKKYIDGDDEREKGQSMVEWWAVNSRRLPTWASLARDYLAIMASSVSSERAFSAAGIMISKCRNRLKADIVEALQVLKYLLQKNLVYCTLPYTSLWEIEQESIEDDDGSPDWVDVVSDDGFSGDDEDAVVL